MEVYIRGIDPEAVTKIDELAKAQDVSRNSFLVNLINNYAALEEFKNFEQRYKDVVHMSLNIIQRNSELMDKIKNTLEIDEN